MIPYDKFTAIIPNRPEETIAPHRLPDFEKGGKNWWLQYKKNGTSTLLYVSPDKEVTALTRHGVPHKAWTNQIGLDRFKEVPGKGWHVFHTELLFSKTQHIKNVNYIHDVLVHDGARLQGQTYEQRYALLKDIFKPVLAGVTNSHYVIDKHTWLARNHESGFAKIFQDLVTNVEDRAKKGLPTSDDEGVVIKNPVFPLPFGKATWQVKSRLPHPNHRH